MSGILVGVLQPGARLLGAGINGARRGGATQPRRQQPTRARPTEESRLNPNNPLGGTSCLHDAWRLICGHFARPFVVHSYGYERLSASQTASQLTSPCIHALMDCLG
ncbi:MAG: hypothetical protein GW790_05145 [Rhodoferax sp.]|nr:hypothetical protein [Rhodoferax sp.]